MTAYLILYVTNQACIHTFMHVMVYGYGMYDDIRPIAMHLHDSLELGPIAMYHPDA